MTAPQIMFGTPRVIIGSNNVQSPIPANNSSTSNGRKYVGCRHEAQSPRHRNDCKVAPEVSHIRPYSSVSISEQNDSFSVQKDPFGRFFIAPQPTAQPKSCGVYLSKCVTWLKSEESEECKDITCKVGLGILVITTILTFALAITNQIDLH